jgi:hypothetical protein
MGAGRSERIGFVWPVSSVSSRVPTVLQVRWSMAQAAPYTFERPTRRLGVRIINAGGRLGERLRGRKPLSVAAILDEARRSTGLDDFGEDNFLEPLRILLDDFAEDAQLHPWGRFLVRRILAGCARNRLLLQDAWRRHPEVLHEDVRRPLYVVGMPRTGTTLLYNLLSQDPHARPLMFWESLFPAPTRWEDRHGSTWFRRQQAAFVAALTHRLAPNLKQVHVINARGPEEDGWLLKNTFVSLTFTLLGTTPRYLDYLERLPFAAMLQVYDYYRRTLQLLQRGETARHWVLKSPVHQGGVAALLTAIPTANVVFTHRDPKEVIPSCCSLVCISRGILSDAVDPLRTGPELTERLALAVARAEAARDQFADRITDVCFSALLADPIGAVRRIYDRFGYRFSADMESRMRRWLEAHPQGKHGAHRYSLAQFGLTAADVDRHFAEYWQRWQQPRAA